MSLFSLLRDAFESLSVALSRGSNWKGQYSEKLAYRKMLELSDEYHIFNDLFLESNGYSTQIDHIVVSPYGVFVVETKGYKGWIFGNEDSECWTQILYRRKYKFYNPIKQNESHVRKIRYLLQNSVDIPIIPIVVFNDNAELKINVQNHIVVNRCYLARAIQQYKERIISYETKQWIIETLNKHLVYEDNEKHQVHMVHIQQSKYRRAYRISQGICPECGGNLVQRNGRYGNFYGCSNYPKCRFTTK